MEMNEIVELRVWLRGREPIEINEGVVRVEPKRQEPTEYGLEATRRQMD